jgi:hypothetical protein
LTVAVVAVVAACRHARHRGVGRVAMAAAPQWHAAGVVVFVSVIV